MYNSTGGVRHSFAGRTSRSACGRVTGGENGQWWNLEGYRRALRRRIRQRHGDHRSGHHAELHDLVLGRPMAASSPWATITVYVTDGTAGQVRPAMDLPVKSRSWTTGWSGRPGARSPGSGCSSYGREAPRRPYTPKNSQTDLIVSIALIIVRAGQRWTSQLPSARAGASHMFGWTQPPEPPTGWWQDGPRTREEDQP